MSGLMHPSVARGCTLILAEAEYNKTEAWVEAAKLAVETAKEWDELTAAWDGLELAIEAHELAGARVRAFH